MLTLYHAPNSRSTRVVALVHAMGKLDEVDIRTVTISRQQGNDLPDDTNPHPEKKVPLLVHNGEMIRESSAIMLYLTDHFKSLLGPQIGETGRGEYLSWLSYYSGVIEPVIVGNFMNVQDNPVFVSTFRGLDEIHASIERGLSRGPWIMGDGFSAADLLISSPYLWAPHLLPENPIIRDWVKRCQEHPSMVWAGQYT